MLYDVIKNIIVGIMLIICSITDICYRKVSIQILAVMSVCIFGTLILSGQLNFGENISGCIIGFIIIGINQITKGKVGLGDGIVFCITGFAIGLKANLILFLYSLFGVFLFALVIWMKRWEKKDLTVPFIPFVCLAYIGMVLGGSIS